MQPIRLPENSFVLNTHFIPTCRTTLRAGLVGVTYFRQITFPAIAMRNEAGVQDAVFLNIVNKKSFLAVVNGKV
jgi:hypothetical protein